MDHVVVRLAALATIVVSAAVACPARADLILDANLMPAQTVVNDFTMFDGVFFVTNGPVDLGDGVIWTAENNGWIGDMAFGLRDNGVWNFDKESFAGLNASFSSMRFDFDSAMSAVGGFLNYAPLEGFGPMPTIVALDADKRILETYTRDIRTPGGINEGQFMGIVREQADIRALQFIARFGVLDDLSYAGTPVPAAPGGLLLLIGGYLTLIRRGRRPVSAIR